MSSATSASAPSEESTADDTAKNSLIVTNLESVKERIKQSIAACNRDADSVRLVAVSKTKPSSAILTAYNAGQRHFGENYAQELASKATELPKDICWHFIGPLQSNKANNLVKTCGDGLYVVETVATVKLARKLNNAVSLAVAEGLRSADKTLGVYLQVNTSGEESKSGVSLEGVVGLAREIKETCPHLEIMGLMTIGYAGDVKDFDALVDCRRRVLEEGADLGFDESSFELSMGMSGDFEVAIAKGSTNVRVGSTIFGERDYSNLKK
eukprot:CAMPEP_0172500226 /NCGR_PEP_ID=MMETSP1066-20121228/135969_1 /TAXON_ID=671091 /ORGANISM="Coscinodiscus wailesii, Strain CCMP2513" /LENGTH=267 /DNA_ID=CAMNT_0013274353 /DNA_START=297 /DNA_END=1100 /DNA_ORIENTATION=+